MADAGIIMVGYVHTSYGDRALSDVEADIDTYATEWTHVSGIFLDEVSSDSSELSYYQSLYDYILGLPGFTYDILNPGDLPDSGYADVATHIVVIEDTPANLADFQAGWLTCEDKQKYAAIINTASGTSDMTTALANIVSQNIYGLVYITEGSNYNTLTSYYATEISDVAADN